MTALISILGLTVACALWVLVQRQADRVLPGNPGVVRDCKGCPQPAETCGPGIPAGGTVGAELVSARVGEPTASTPSRGQTSCSPTASPPDCEGVATPYRHPSRGQT